MIFLKSTHYIQAFCSFFLFIIFLGNYRNINQKFKLVGAAAFVSVMGNIFQITSTFFFHSAYMNQIGEAYQLFFAFIISLFFLQINRSKFSQLLFYLFNLSCFVCWVLLLVYLNDNNLFSIYSVITYVGLILFAILYFTYLLKYLPAENLLRIPEFWVAAAVLFNFSGYLIVTLTYGYLVEVLKENMILYWSFYNVFSIIFFSVLSYALLLHIKTVKIALHEH
ncbi:MAG: hypothetical protein O9340_03825 [Cyclobacteriaceae bacterium]|nr:hypothetical protein [Cyclobacteriaceae bacterium]